MKRERADRPRHEAELARMAEEAAASKAAADKAKQKAKEEAVRIANEMNECFYAIGSKKELSG